MLHEQYLVHSRTFLHTNDFQHPPEDSKGVRLALEAYTPDVVPIQTGNPCCCDRRYRCHVYKLPGRLRESREGTARQPHIDAVDYGKFSDPPGFRLIRFTDISPPAEACFADVRSPAAVRGSRGLSLYIAAVRHGDAGSGRKVPPMCLTPLHPKVPDKKIFFCMFHAIHLPRDSYSTNSLDHNIQSTR